MVENCSPVKQTRIADSFWKPEMPQPQWWARLTKTLASIHLKCINNFIVPLMIIMWQKLQHIYSKICHMANWTLSIITQVLSQNTLPSDVQFPSLCPCLRPLMVSVLQPITKVKHKSQTKPKDKHKSTHPSYVTNESIGISFGGQTWENWKGKLSRCIACWVMATMFYDVTSYNW